MTDALNRTVPVALDAATGNVSRKDAIPIAVPVLDRGDAPRLWPNRSVWLCGCIAALAILVAFYPRSKVQESVLYATPIQNIVPLFIEKHRAQAGLCPLCSCRSSQSRVCTSLVLMSRQAWLNFDGMCSICPRVDENKEHAVPVDEQLERGLAVMTTDSLYKVADPVCTLLRFSSRVLSLHPFQKCRNQLDAAGDMFKSRSNQGIHHHKWKYAVGASLRESIVDTLSRLQPYYSCYLDDHAKNAIHDHIAFWFFAFNGTYKHVEEFSNNPTTLIRELVAEVDMTMHSPLTTVILEKKMMM